MPRILLFHRLMARSVRTVVVNVPRHEMQPGNPRRLLTCARRKTGNFPSVPGFLKRQIEARVQERKNDPMKKRPLRIIGVGTVLIAVGVHSVSAHRARFSGLTKTASVPSLTETASSQIGRFAVKPQFDAALDRSRRR